MEKRGRLAQVIPDELNQRIIDSIETLEEALEDEWAVYVVKKFSQGGKLPVARHFSRMDDADFGIRMACLEPLIDEIVDYLFS